MSLRFLLVLGLAAAANAQLPPACNPYPNCLYTSGPAQPFTTAATTVSYRDAAGDIRTLDLFIRAPGGVSSALPTMIWSHAADVSGPVQTLMAAWGEGTARAGYLTVNIGHPLRDRAQAERLCIALRVDEEHCLGIGFANWDRPHDLTEVISWLEKANADPDSPLRGRVDTKRIAVGGHADGGHAAISLAGAKRLLTTSDRKKPNDFTDTRPAAFVSLSPQGPLINGFYDTSTFEPTTSWMDIARPVLLATGAGDNDCREPSTCRQGDTPSRRRVPFEVMPNGGKYLMFVNSVKISHDFVGSLDTAGCAAAGVAPAQCTNFADWLRAAVLAFLDANLKESRAALVWLREGLVKDASRNVAELQSK